MNDIHVPQDERGEGRQARQLVGRELEMGRIRQFLAAVRTDGGALLVTGEPGVGKTDLMNAASEAASAMDMRILQAAGVEFEAETSFSSLNQLLLPLLDALPQLAAIHRDALNVALGFSDGTPRASSSCRMRFSRCFARKRLYDPCSSSSMTCRGWTEGVRAC